MNKENMLGIIKDLINKYLCSSIDKNETYIKLANSIGLSENIENDDEPPYCDVTDEELTFHMDCIDNKIKFSRNERDRIIQSRLISVLSSCDSTKNLASVGTESNMTSE